jgi:hypothetical protein
MRLIPAICLLSACCFTPPTPAVPAPPAVPPAPIYPPSGPPTMPMPPPGMPGMPGMPPGMPGMPTGPLPGAGVLPAVPLVWAGVNGPQPMPGAPAGIAGEIRTSGTATVRLATGSLPGVSSGTVCAYVQFRVTSPGGFDCRWNVTCGNTVVYGLGDGGYQYCTDPAWPPGVLMMDPNMTSSDSDPMFIFNPGGISLSDDTGPYGPFNLTLTVP